MSSLTCTFEGFTDRRLVRHFKTGDRSAGLALHYRYKNLITKRFQGVRARISFDDYCQEAWIAVDKALNWVDENKIKDENWKFLSCLDYFLRDLNRKIFTQKKEPESSTLDFHSFYPRPEEEAEDRMRLEELNSTLNKREISPRQHKLLKLRFQDGQSQESSAKILGVSRTRIQQLEKAVFEKIRDLLEKTSGLGRILQEGAHVQPESCRNLAGQGKSA